MTATATNARPKIASHPPHVVRRFAVDRSRLEIPFPAGQRRLGGCQARHRRPVWRATDVVESEIVTELDRARLSTMLSADPQLDVRPGPATHVRPRFASDFPLQIWSSTWNGFAGKMFRCTYSRRNLPSASSRLIAKVV